MKHLTENKKRGKKTTKYKTMINDQRTKGNCIFILSTVKNIFFQKSSITDSAATDIKPKHQKKAWKLKQS